MSQVTYITAVQITGSQPYLGALTQPDATLVDTWSADPDTVMRWLCDGSRFRFNQHRSTRNKYATTDTGELIMTDGKKTLVPIGGTVDLKTDREARAAHSHLRAFPSQVLQPMQRAESSEWFAAAKRRGSNTKAGRPAGDMPRFRARNHTDLTLTCFRHAGAAEFIKTGRRSGHITIAGQNPADKRGTAKNCAYSIRVKIRFGKGTVIRPYTSVKINWTTKELVFVSPPPPVTGKIRPGIAAGFDQGVVHTLADDAGNFYDAPDTRHLQRQLKAEQRRMAKSREVAAKQKRQFWTSHNYQDHKAKAAALSAKIVRVRVDFAHKTSTDIIRRCDMVVVEKLNLRNMTRKGRGKRGLNRVMQDAALGRVVEFLSYKSEAAGVILIQVNPAFTSQRCKECRHVSKENRKSQADFRCTACVYVSNADTNAAGNVLQLGFDELEQQQTAELERLAQQQQDMESAGPDRP